MLDLEGLHTRAALLRSIREFFFSRGFLEVDTPLRQPVIIPEGNIIPITAEGQYLQTSPELCMKRMLAAGCTHIFQICPCFRKNERGRNHLEEFTMLEWYRRDADYHQLMADCEALLGFVVPKVAKYMAVEQRCSKELCDIQAILTADAERLTVAEAFSRYSPVPLRKALEEDRFDEVLVEYVEPHLGKDRPLFLLDYPAELASLARVKSACPPVAERFELYILGVELANGFTELTDPVEQRLRFTEEIERISRLQGRTHSMPERFLQELAQLESAAGIALGLDRLLMQITGKVNIQEVVSFNPGDFL